MKISVLTVFPEFFDSFLQTPVVKRVCERGELTVETVDIKKFAGGSFRHIDDSPFGGGPGMILRAEPILSALRAVGCETAHTVLLSPKGTPYHQRRARQLAKTDHLILICGHYEGIDARVENHVDEQISIGDYILTGGEIAATAVIDSVARLLKGALRDGATEDESHETGRLEYPQYTRPAVLDGEAVPEVLLSGNDRNITRWRRVQSLLLTKKLRPDLLEEFPLTAEEKELLAQEEAFR